MPDLYANQPDKALKEYISLFLRGIGADPKPRGAAR